MTAPAIDLSEYANRKVLVRFDSDEAELEKGTVTAATPLGIIFKPYGKSNADLVPAARIRHIELQPDDSELKPRRVNPATLANVKRHLVDWHGYKLADVNAMTPEAALAFHEGTMEGVEKIDHSLLGHYHAEAPSKGNTDEAGED